MTRAAFAVAILATALLMAPATASAISRDRVIARSKTWVVKRVPYSQSGYYKGYRRDCSGFVSMAWSLKKSYTTRTISSRAKRVPISKLKPGDAVLEPGHVSIFGGWKNKRARTYYAYEQTTWGSHAKRRVRTARARAKGLRLRGIQERRPTPVISRKATRRALDEIRTASYRNRKIAHGTGEFGHVFLTLDQR